MKALDKLKIHFYSSQFSFDTILQALSSSIGHSVNTPSLFTNIRIVSQSKLIVICKSFILLLFCITMAPAQSLPLSSIRTPTGTRMITPVIPLTRPVKKEARKDNMLTFKLRTNPAQADSTTYELSVTFFSDGTPEELLLFLRNVEKVIVGLNITDGPGRYALIRRLLQGDALATFDQAATTRGNETIANYRLARQDLITHVFPHRALLMQKRYMRRFLRKPQDTKIREFMARLVEINAYLDEFPPFEVGQSLPNDEIMEIAEYAVPVTWQRTMVIQGYDPMAHGQTVTFVEFCERIEFTEGDSGNTTNNGSKTKTDSKNGHIGGKSHAKSSAGGNKSSNKRKHSEESYCEYHGVSGHSTGECKVMLAQAKKMRENFETHKSSTNRVWRRNDPKNTKQEHHSIEEQVKNLVEQFFMEKANSSENADEDHFNIEDYDNFLEEQKDHA